MVSSLLYAGWRQDLLDGRVRAVMAQRSLAPESTEMVAERLTLLREALELSQAEICRRTGIGTSQWNNAETADNRLSVDNAAKLRQTFGIGHDYTFAGDFRALPEELATKIGRLMASR